MTAVRAQMTLTTRAAARTHDFGRADHRLPVRACVVQSLRDFAHHLRAGLKSYNHMAVHGCGRAPRRFRYRADVLACGPSTRQRPLLARQPPRRRGSTRWSEAPRVCFMSHFSPSRPSAVVWGGFGGYPREIESSTRTPDPRWKQRARWRRERWRARALAGGRAGSLRTAARGFWKLRV